MICNMDKDENLIRLEEAIKGKVISEVVYTSIDRFAGNIEVPCDDSEITIIFTDGSKLTTWNSEWGGITYR